MAKVIIGILLIIAVAVLVVEILLPIISFFINLTLWDWCNFFWDLCKVVALIVVCFIAAGYALALDCDGPNK